MKDTTKTSLADSLIEFFDHHSNFWTKVRVLLCSWSLGLSVGIKFVNFGRRLVSFPFFGSFRVITEKVWTEIGHQLVKLGEIEDGLVKLDIFMIYWRVQFQKISLRVKSPNFGYRVYRAHCIIGPVGVQFR